MKWASAAQKLCYAVLNLPAAYSPTYQVIDLLYQQIPVANLYMEPVKD